MKYLTTTIICSLAFSTCAAGAWNGSYIGAGLSYQSLDMNHIAGLNANAVNDPENFSRTINTNGNRLAPHLSLGYTRTVNKLYLAAEANLDMINQSFWDDPLDINQRTRLNWVSNVDIKIGRLITPSAALYLLFGGATARLHASYGGNSISSTFITLQQNSSSRQIFAYQLGAGMRYALADHWSAELSYHHNFWESTGFSLNDRYITFMNPVGHSTVRLDSNNVVWQLVYRF